MENNGAEIMRKMLVVIAAFVLANLAFADDCDTRGVKSHFTIQTLPATDVEVGYTWNFGGDLAICGQCGWANVTGSPTVQMDWGDGNVGPLNINMVGGQPH